MDDIGKPAWLGIICSEADSKWDIISDSKLHLAAKTSNGTTACLDVDSNNVVMTNICKCLSRDSSCDPSSQWFKLVDSARRPRLESSAESESVLEIHNSDFKGKPLVMELIKEN